MSNIAIKAENISKYYRLGQINNGTLYADIQSWFARKLGKEDPHAKIGFDTAQSDKDGFWALKDINFEIKQGDRVGIIGRNGAGKSTLLKVISEITTPTTGNIYIKGRVASLLEVGTGFHPEMTGRENIYMNGAILGMKRAEITRQLDEIIDFAEIEKYIDTPVKRYSSGMYVRLAFAVAAHLQSEILIADEVLAVGDAQFQKKAIGKMSDLSTGEGRTILFVSHNMGAVKELCKNGIVLDRGKIRINNSIDNAISNYLTPEKSQNGFWECENKANKDICITRIELSTNGNITNLFDSTDKIKCKIFYTVNKIINFCNFSFRLLKDGYVVFHSWDLDTDEKLARKELGNYEVSFFLPDNLGLGNYVISLDCGIPNIGLIDNLENCLSFEISNININSSSRSLTRGGIINPQIKWEIRKLS